MFLPITTPAAALFTVGLSLSILTGGLFLGFLVALFTRNARQEG